MGTLRVLKTIEDLNEDGYPMTPEIQKNLDTLFVRLKTLQYVYGKQLFITSGLRSFGEQQHLIDTGKSKAKKSNHLTGSAVDVYDADRFLNAWCKNNNDKLAEIGFWMEERQGNWQHFQIVPPRSGKRWFYP